MRELRQIILRTLRARYEQEKESFCDKIRVRKDRLVELEQEDMPVITLHVKGGSIIFTESSKSAAHVQVIARDYDVDGVDEEYLEEDEDGQPFREFKIC